MKFLLPIRNLRGTTDKAAETEVKGDVEEKINNDTRVVFSFDKELTKNPEGNFTMNTDISQQDGMFILNKLMSIRYDLFNVFDDIYVTHFLKTLTSNSKITKTGFETSVEEVTEYLEDTLQTPDSFKLGLVIDTVNTLFTHVVQCKLGTPIGDRVPVEFLDLELKLEPYYIDEFTCFYPIHVIVSKTSVKLDHNGDGEFNLSGAFVVAADENRRAIL